MKSMSPNPTASPPLAYDAQLWNRQSKMCWDSCQCKLGPVRDVRILGLLTQQNPAHASHRFTETQHTNIRPHKTLSLPLHPPTSPWHTSKAHPRRLEERGELPVSTAARWQPSVPTAWRSCTAWTQSSTGRSQGLFHSAEEGSKDATTMCPFTWLSALTQY